MVSVRKGTTMEITDGQINSALSLVGYDALLEKIDSMYNPDSMQQCAEDIASMMKETAVMLVPVDTGALKASLNTSITSDEEGLTVSLGTNLHYAPYVEYGTGMRGQETGKIYGGRESTAEYSVEINGIKAQPYLRPALYDNENRIRNRIMKEMTLDDREH